MALPKLELRYTVPSGGQSISVTDSGGSDTVILLAGNYYIAGTTSLLSALQTGLNASGTLAGTYALSLDDTSDSAATGKVTISCDRTFSVTWNSDVMMAALGFTGNLSSASTYTGSNSSKYVFLPNCGRSGALSPEPSSTSYNLGANESDYRVTVSPSGYTTTLTYNRRYRDTMNFENLKGNKAWKCHETVTNESLQTFIETMIDDGGSPFKFFPSRTDDTVAFQLVFAEGFTGFAPAPVVENWVGASSLWSFAANVRKKI